MDKIVQRYTEFKDPHRLLTNTDYAPQFLNRSEKNSRDSEMDADLGDVELNITPSVSSSSQSLVTSTTITTTTPITTNSSPSSQSTVTQTQEPPLTSTLTPTFPSSSPTSSVSSLRTSFQPTHSAPSAQQSPTSLSFILNNLLLSPTPSTLKTETDQPQSNLSFSSADENGMKTSNSTANRSTGAACTANNAEKEKDSLTITLPQKVIELKIEIPDESSFSSSSPHHFTSSTPPSTPQPTPTGTLTGTVGTVNNVSSSSPDGSASPSFFFNGSRNHPRHPPWFLSDLSRSSPPSPKYSRVHYEPEPDSTLPPFRSVESGGTFENNQNLFIETGKMCREESFSYANLNQSFPRDRDPSSGNGEKLSRKRKFPEDETCEEE
eukprot:TRINITY_DN3508_c0_g1_i1.p1 TRINITY_DN3508_c0_g1~~TRINITY_DN3508_c0_g1_i1.p1  ORF type:complete len:437 (-),score=89.60 TRINITY_DN3508_c0_g1_i1:544-1680(-)